MTHNTVELFRELVKIEVNLKIQRYSRGRPVSLTFDDAWNSILLILRTGMQWSVSESPFRSLERFYVPSQRPVLRGFSYARLL